MRIEFATIGDGTNVEVLLIDDTGVVARAYTTDHRGGIHYNVEIQVRELFQWVQDFWSPPIIGGHYSHLHLYWAEREAKKGLTK